VGHQSGAADLQRGAAGHRAHLLARGPVGCGAPARCTVTRGARGSALRQSAACMSK
jgi:hypothetical protein